MSAFLTELQKLKTDLDSMRLKWAIIGGLAYSIYADPRTTKDIDVAVATDSKQELEEIVLHLLKQGYKDKQLLMRMNPTHRLGMRVSLPTSRRYSIPVDLLTDSSGIEREIVEEAKIIEILPSLSLPVASLSHILAMKILASNDADREQDKLDAKALMRVATQEELDDTKKALLLITERGHNRGKDLIQEFSGFLQRCQ